MRKGFTLVELLIVIVIIGILAAAMLLSSGSATASAQASTIVSDLRSLKSAVMMCWADSMDAFEDGTLSVPTISMVRGYMDNPDKINSARFAIVRSSTGDTAGKWFVQYKTSVNTPEVLEKLKGRAKTTGLLKGTDSLSNVYEGTGDVYMVAR